MPEIKNNGASLYREIREARRAAQLKTAETVAVAVPSGMVFECCVPTLESYVLSGLMPMSLTEKLSSVMKPEQNVDLKSVLSENDAKNTLIFAREMVRDICVNPRIVENPQNEDEIAPHEILIEDFAYLVKWGMSQMGGAEAPRFDTFRQQPNLDAVARPRRKKRRQKTKRNPRN